LCRRAEHAPARRNYTPLPSVNNPAACAPLIHQSESRRFDRPECHHGTLRTPAGRGRRTSAGETPEGGFMTHGAAIRNIHRHLALAGTALACLTPALACAQSNATAPLPTEHMPPAATDPATPAQAQPAPLADTSVGIEDIIVTAQKRSQSAQNVPIAITALNSDQLRAAGVSSTADLKATVPALNITTATAGYGLPRIRGIGATGQGPGIENPVAVYVDGVYYGAAFGVLQSLFDVDQVAVLKGPQGTLFGRNATGGLIQITTMGPSFEPTARAEVGYGNYDTVHAAGYASGGLTDTLAVSLAAQYENQPQGFGKNLYTGNDIQTSQSWAGRAKLLWKPDADTSFLLAGDFNGREGADPAFRNFQLNTLGQNVEQQIVALGGNPDRDIYSDTDPSLRARQWGTSLTASRDLGGVTLKSITAYRKTDLSFTFDPDGTTVKQLVVANTQYDKQFSEEVNLVSDGKGPFKWVLGGFYLHDSSGLDPARVTGLFTFGNNGYLDINANVKLDSYAAFAEGTYTFGASTNLTAGLRYTSDDRSLYATTTTYNGNIGVTTTSTPTVDTRNFSRLTWRVSLDHRFSPELLAYASYNRGFRSGTFIPQATPIITLEPEVIDAYEVGIKSDLFDRRVRFNLSAYYYNESNLQVMQVIAGLQNVYNADGARIYGLDGDVTWKVTNNLRLFGGVNYTHARYTNFTDAIVSVPFPLPAGFVVPAGQTCLGTFGNPYAQLGGNCLLRGDASGNKLQNTPAFTGSVGGSLDIPTASAGKFTLAGNFYYNDGYVGAPDERVYQTSYQTVDASITWHMPNDHLYVRVWGKNLTDTFYRTQIGSTNSGDNGTNAAPRTYGVTAGFEF
jgi:iron complex outermembrane receptor protein